MIDIFALALVHGLILIVLLRLAGDPALDTDPEIEKRRYRKSVHGRSVGGRSVGRRSVGSHSGQQGAPRRRG
ncbi:MAG: hypothetical protein WA948_12115 [Pontixanthobacter sp.]